MSVVDDGGSEVRDSIRTHINHLLSELESSESQITPTVRAIYEGGFEGQFSDCLSERISSLDKDIEVMCSYHYQGFIDCVKELLKVQSMVKTLQGEITDIDAHIQDSSVELIQSHESMISHRLELKNMALTIQAIKLCIPVLDLYNKLKKEMSNKNYYSAIKILGHLEHTHLPPISSFSFASIMAQQIPKTRQTIKDVSRCDMKEFLKSIREMSPDIGMNALWQAQGALNIPMEHVLGRRPASTEDGPLDFINFAPIYYCLHIYSVIGERVDFAKEYHADRKLQADLTFKYEPRAPVKTDQMTQDQREDQEREEAKNVVRYFSGVVGFFVIENTLLHTTQGLVTHTTIDELWNHFLHSLGSLDQFLLYKLEKPQQLLDLKLLLVLFCQTLSGYELNVSKLYKQLIDLYQKYCDSLQRVWKSKFRQVFDHDNYSPLSVESDIELETLMGCAYPAVDPDHASSFPLNLPFSHLVPEIFRLMEEYIGASLQFATHLDLSQTEVDDLVRKSTNELLTNTLNECLLELIKKERLVLSQIVQISINTTFLQKYSHCMETFVSSKTGCTVADTTRARDLYGLKMFVKVKEEAKTRIHAKLMEKIDAFFELSRYNWMTSETRDNPSDYMNDLLNYLKNTFKTFTQLEQNVACGACEAAGKHIAKKLYDIFVDPSIGQMTRVALEILDQDVIAYEGFALDQPVSGVSQISLLIPIQSLRNLINMIKQGEYDKYIAEYQPGQRTQSVDPDVLASILERFLPKDRQRFSFKAFTQNKNEKEMNQLLETVIKKLRSLDHGGTEGSNTPTLLARKMSRSNLNF